jgi:hypothetical protein
VCQQNLAKKTLWNYEFIRSFASTILPRRDGEVSKIILIFVQKYIRLQRAVTNCHPKVTYVFSLYSTRGSVLNNCLAYSSMEDSSFCHLVPFFSLSFFIYVPRNCTLYLLHVLCCSHTVSTFHSFSSFRLTSFPSSTFSSFPPFVSRATHIYQVRIMPTTSYRSH